MVISLSNTEFSSGAPQSTGSRRHSVGSVESEHKRLAESWFWLGRGQCGISPEPDRVLIVQVHVGNVATFVIIQFIYLLLSVFFLFPPLA